jgi:hypothetical protein
MTQPTTLLSVYNMCNLITKKHKHAYGLAVLPSEGSGGEKIAVGKYVREESHWIRKRLAINRGQEKDQLFPGSSRPPF